MASLLPFGLLLQMLLNLTDRRSRDLRLVLGRHGLGSSDPAMWAPDAHRALGFDMNAQDTRALLQKSSATLAARDFPNAMLGARLAVAYGASAEGEALTDRILADPHVRSWLPRLRLKPWLRCEWLDEVKPAAPAERGTQTRRQKCWVTGNDVQRQSFLPATTIKLPGLPGQLSLR